MGEDWAAEFEERFARWPGGIDPGLARAAMMLFRELPRSAEDAVLLCTDLHGGNVLAAQREPWLVIDPKPYVGDRTYDALQHMLNCEQRLVTDPWRFAQAMSLPPCVGHYRKAGLLLQARWLTRVRDRVHVLRAALLASPLEQTALS